MRLLIEAMSVLFETLCGMDFPVTKAIMRQVLEDVDNIWHEDDVMEYVHEDGALIMLKRQWDMLFEYVQGDDEGLVHGQYVRGYVNAIRLCLLDHTDR